MTLGKTQILILAAIAASAMFLLYSPALYSLDAQAEATQPQLQSPSTCVQAVLQRYALCGLLLLDVVAMRVSLSCARAESCCSSGWRSFRGK
jgi:hypothetical protein